MRFILAALVVVLAQMLTGTPSALAGSVCGPDVVLGPACAAAPLADNGDDAGDQ